jgi:nitrogen-specific signal transduction histidine kinase
MTTDDRPEPPKSGELDTDAVQALRHDLRNHLATIRNAAFYLERRMRRTDAWESDKRVPQFFELIERELEAAAQSITERTTVEHLSGKDKAG